MRRFPKAFLIQAVGVSLLAHVIILVIFGSVVIFVNYAPEEPEFEAPPIAEAPTEPLEQIVRLQKNMQDTQKPRPPRITVQNISSLNPPRLNINLPDIKTGANFAGYGKGAGGLGGMEISSTSIDIKAFGTTKRLDYAFKGTIRTFEKIDRLRSGDRWFIGEGEKRLSKHIYNYSFNLPLQSFEKGFPGVTNQFEWFSLDFETELYWPAYLAGEYEFRLNSDDGSIFQVDGRDVIDNDGLHAMESKTGRVRLDIGKHVFRLVYFQGPRPDIGLILEYRKVDGGDWQIFDVRKLLAYQNKQA